MDQSKNINPNTGSRSNIILNVNADFLADDNSIIINDITDDTITFTTGASVLSSAFLQYSVIDECNGLSALATASSWCTISDPPIITDKIISFYENSTYTLNVITGEVIIVNTPSTAGDGTVTSTTGWDRPAITNYNGTLLSSNFVKIVNASSPNATVTFTDNILTIATADLPAGTDILPINITYTIEDECKQTTATLSGANNTSTIATTNVFNGQSTGSMSVPQTWRKYAFSGTGSSTMSATSGWYTVCFDSYSAPDGFYVQLRSQVPALDSCGNTWFPSIIWGTNVVSGIVREFGPYGDSLSGPMGQGGARFLYFKPENYEMYLWGRGPAGSAYELGITQVFGVSGSTATQDLGIDPSTGFPELTAPPTDTQLVAFLDAYSRQAAFPGETLAQLTERAPGRLVPGTGASARGTWVGWDGQVDRTPEAQAFIPGVTDARFTGTRSILDGTLWNTWPTEMNARPTCAP